MRKRAIAARALEATRFGNVARRMGAWTGLVALGYHRIGRAGDSLFDHGLWSASAEAFDEQLRFLKENYDIIQSCDLLDVQNITRGRHVIVTFDDGYRDNYGIAYPILKSHRVPATFFVTTGFIDQPKIAWWDEISWMVRSSSKDRLPAGHWIPETVAFEEPNREEAVRTLLRVYKTLPLNSTEAYLDYLAQITGSGRLDPSAAADLWMTWDMIREMQAGGMHIGGHTVTHPMLSNVSHEQQEREIIGCADRIYDETGQRMVCFSYPDGGRGQVSPETRQYLAQAGVKFAFSYYGGFRTSRDWDPYDIRRVPIEADMQLELFRTTLTLPTLFA